MTIGPNGKPIITEPPPPPVIRVSGAFCGTAFWTAGPAIVAVLENAEVDLVDHLGHVVAKSPTDESGKFTFPALPVGKYRATLAGFMSTEEVIEIRNTNR